MLDPRDLTTFLAVFDTGSVSAASAMLFLTQPTLSRQVAALEREVGTSLFRRTPKGMVPTPGGERLEPLARDIVRRARRAQSVMAELAGQDLSFSIVCPETTANGFVAPYMAAGGAIADVLTVAPGDVWDTQTTRGIDIGVTTSMPPKGMHSFVLERLAVRCMVPRGHEFDSRESIELRELTARPIVIPGSGSAVARVVAEAAADAGFGLEAVFASNGTIAQARSAAGRGPSLVVEEPKFDLVGIRLEHDGSALVVPFYAGWERTHYADPAIRKTAERLRAFMRSRSEQLGLLLLPPESDLP